MIFRPLSVLSLALFALALAGCASRPVNAPIAAVDASTGYRFGTRQLQDADAENLVVLAFSGGGTRAAAFDVPDIEIYAIDVSFQGLKDRAEFDYLNDLPTSFVLPPKAVDRLRQAAEELVLESPEFVRLLHDIGAHMLPAPAKVAAGTD
jgi:hypothetical protein